MRTWAALCDPTSVVHGLVAEQEDHLAALIQAVYAFADGSALPASNGSPRNTTARNAPPMTPSPVGDPPFVYQR